MADIQPKNTDTIRVNNIAEKTAASSISLKNITKVDDLREYTGSAGVTLNQIIKVLSTGAKPLTASISLGTSTAAEHFLEEFLKTLTSNGQTLTIRTTSANDIVLALNSNTIWTFAQSTGNIDGNSSNCGNITFGKGLTGVCLGVSATFTALGTTQGTAAPIVNAVTVVTTSSAGVTDGVLLPAITATTLGKELAVCNESGGSIKVYPATGANIDDGAANASVTVTDNTHKKYMPITTTRWLSF